MCGERHNFKDHGTTTETKPASRRTTKTTEKGEGETKFRHDRREGGGADGVEEQAAATA